MNESFSVDTRKAACGRCGAPARRPDAPVCLCDGCEKEWRRIKLGTFFAVAVALLNVLWRTDFSTVLQGGLWQHNQIFSVGLCAALIAVVPVGLFLARKKFIQRRSDIRSERQDNGTRTAPAPMSNRPKPTAANADPVFAQSRDARLILGGAIAWVVMSGTLATVFFFSDDPVRFNQWPGLAGIAGVALAITLFVLVPHLSGIRRRIASQERGLLATDLADGRITALRESKYRGGPFRVEVTALSLSREVTFSDPYVPHKIAEKMLVGDNVAVRFDRHHPDDFVFLIDSKRR